VSRKPVVVVVGAGYAGLAAADSLLEAEVDVVVLEALDRVGGRVWSERLPNGAVVERGAEFVTRGYETMERRTARLGLELRGMGIHYPERRILPDPGIDRARVVAAIEAVERAAREAPARPAAAVLSETVDDADIRELLLSRLQSSHAYPAAELEAAFLADLGALVDRLETRRIAGGNQLLATRLAERLGARLRLGSRVRRIAEAGASVVVSTDTGELAGDACILAVPAPAVRRLDLSPPLPTPVAAAYARLRMSTAAKLAAPLTAPAVPDAVMSAAGRWWAYTTTGDEVGGRSVGAWAGAAPVVELVGARDGAARWLDGIEALRPELSIERQAALVTIWDEHGWVEGAYSVQPHSWDGLRGPLEGPVGRIAFAGEHTARDWVATMEGALRSGERAARDVLAIVGVRT
jgi:monoamine oxidase